MRYAVILVILNLGLLVEAAVPTEAARTVEHGSIVQVLDAATVDIQVDGTTQRVHLLGIGDADVLGQSQSPSCTVGSAALARTHELVDNQTVTLEIDPASGAPDVLGRIPGRVGLANGSDLGEILLSEGLARAQVTDRPYADEAAYTAAEAMALNGGVGIWARDACPALPPPPGLAQFVVSMLDQMQIASTAIGVLHQQTVGATSFAPALAQPAWRQSTAYALAEVDSSGGLLEGTDIPSTIAPPLAGRLVQMGGVLKDGAAAYAQALDGQDVAMVGASDHQLESAAASLQPLKQHLAAFAATYQFGD